MKTILPILLLVASLPLAGQSAPLKNLPSEGCSRTILKEDARPAYTLSGAWQTPSQLALVDIVENRVVTINPEGRFTGFQPKTVEAAIESAFQESFLPISAQRGQDGTWIELVGGRFAKVTTGEQGEEVAATQDLWGTELEKDAKLIAVLGWALAGDNIFGYGNFEMSDESIRTGFFRNTLEGHSDGNVLYSRPNGDTTQLWYRLGLPFVTSIGETGYALNMDKRLSIVKSAPGGDSISTVGGFTGQLRTPAAIPPFESPNDFPKIMEKLSSSTAPMGLHGWNGKLYLLWRRQSGEGGTWLLSRIDPERPASEALEATATVNSDAEHLLAIPGPKYWAFVEKGPVEGYMSQASDSVLFAPSSGIRSDFAHGQVLCRSRD